MTLRRGVALAQALTLVLIFAPGPHQVGPSSVRAAVVPAEPDSALVFDASGKGIGCPDNKRRFKGPREPKDPPWPPGAEPTPSPTPSPDPSADASTAPEESTEPDAAASMAFLANSGVRVAQVEPTSEPTPSPTPEADAPARKGKKSKLIRGIDVSHWQGDIDFAKVRDSGVRFVFIKATQDTDHVDSYFKTNMAQAQAAGLTSGAYHFFDYTLDGKAQADHFLDRVEAGNGLDGALPPVVDVECYRSLGSSIHVVAETRLRDFVDRVYRRTGRLPIVYASQRSWNQVVGDPDGFHQLPLWAACWGCAAPPTLAAGWNDWTFWQTTDVGKVKGVKGRVDGNYFNGTKADLEAMKLRPFTIDEGATITAKQRVVLELGGRDGRQFRTSADGETWTKWSPVRSKVRAGLQNEDGEQTLYVQLRARGVRSPVLSDSITLDRVGPEVGDPEVTLREGPVDSAIGSVPVAVRWLARDELAGLSDATITVTCGDGPAQRTEAPGSAEPDEAVTWEGAAALAADTSCNVTAIARDGVGNTTRSTTGLEVSRRSVGDAVAGDQVGVVAQRGPDVGRAAVLLDGEVLGLVDLYAPEPSGPEIVFVADLAPSTAGIVTVEATGTSDPASSGSGIRVDGLVALGPATARPSE